MKECPSCHYKGHINCEDCVTVREGCDVECPDCPTCGGLGKIDES